MPLARLTWKQVLAWRVRRQHLDERAPRKALLKVVGDLCGLHAQVMSSAELTLWARVEGLEAEDVHQALWDDRSLVKTWAMRGTLHLLPAAEFSMWQAALGQYRHYLNPVWLRAFGVTAAELEQLIQGVVEALDGRMSTREELAGEVARITGSEELGEKLRESWGAMLKPAAFRGQLCFARSVGQKVRFTRPDQRLKADEPVDGDTAVAEVTRRFLGTYGPAAREDYARWWGCTPADAGQRIQALGDEVVEVDVEGWSAWMLGRHVEDAAVAAASSVRLLPAFDQYVVGATRQRDEILPDVHRSRVYRPQGWLSPVLLVDGRMVGVWRHERKGARLLVRIEPFAKIVARARVAAEGEAERLAAFTGGALEVSWSD